MSNLLQETGLSKQDLGRIRHSQNRQNVQGIESLYDVDTKKSNALSYAMLKTRETEAAKRDKLLNTVKAVKNWALDETFKRIPFSGIVKNVLFPKSPSAHDAVDSVIKMGSNLVDSAANKLFSKKKVKYQPDVPPGDFLVQHPAESTKYQDGGYVDREMYNIGGDVPVESAVQEDGYRGDWRDKQIIEDFQNRKKMNAFQQAMMQSHEDIKFRNPLNEMPDKFGEDQSQKELTWFEMQQHAEEKAKQKAMGANIWQDSHYRNQMPQYAIGGQLSGPSHNEGGIPIEAEGGEYIVPAGYDPKYEPLLEAMRRETLINR